MSKIFSFILSIFFWGFICFVALDTLDYFDINEESIFNEILFKDNKQVNENKTRLLNNEKVPVSVDEDDSINVVFYPYYEMLEEKEQSVYNQVYENAKSRKSTFKPLEDIDVDRMTSIVEAVYNDHPELFWLDTSFEYRYTEDNICTEIILNFNDTSSYFDEASVKFESITNEIVSYAKDLETDYEKEKYVHNKLIEMIEYDENAELNQTAYSALVNKSTVCAGYARAFQHIMIMLGIPTYYVTGEARGEHAWNIVKLGSRYYNVDLTWNDNEYDVYAYFNMTDEEFSSNHTRSKISMELPKCEA